MHDASHAEGHHDHHGAVAAEPDDVNAAAVAGWGIGMFIVVIGFIAIASAYFWQGLVTAEDHKAEGAEYFSTYKAKLAADEKAALGSYKKLDNGRYQIPIADAIKLTAKDLSSRAGGR